jgi:hypothetical protein
LLAEMVQTAEQLKPEFKALIAQLPGGAITGPYYQRAVCRCVTISARRWTTCATGKACIYILFPEGARTRDGAMLPFKPGVGMKVAGTEVPVVPCYLSGTFEVFPANRVLPRLLPITLRIGTPLTFAEAPNSADGWRRWHTRSRPLSVV